MTEALSATTPPAIAVVVENLLQQFAAAEHIPDRKGQEGEDTNERPDGDAARRVAAGFHVFQRDGSRRDIPPDLDVRDLLTVVRIVIFVEQLLPGNRVDVAARFASRELNVVAAVIVVPVRRVYRDRGLPSLDDELCEVRRHGVGA